MSQEPLHPNSQPRDGWYWVYGKAPDPKKPRTNRPMVPVRVWTVEHRDPETGALIDDQRQWIQFGSKVMPVNDRTQHDWLFAAKHPISQEEYEALYITGDWK